MARSIYIASAEGDTGKSTIALGITRLLTRTVGRVGIFRPVARVADGSDYVLDLLIGQDGVVTSYDDAIGVTYEDVHADPEAALATVVARYHEVARHAEVVVIVGTDYTDVSGAAEFAFNARIAANLGSPVALVVHGRDRTPAEIARVVGQTRAELEEDHARVAAVFANRCEPSQLQAIRESLPADIGMGALPEDPILTAPLLSALVEAVDGTLISGDPALLNREVRSVNIGAMTAAHLLERIDEGTVVITPGDRSDTLLALLSAHAAEGFPSLTGIILNGGFSPEPSIARLIEGLGSSLPVITTEIGTYGTARRCWNTRGRVSSESAVKVDTALSMFERHVDAEAMLALLDVARTDVVTPLMFEHDLLDRARSERQHIVLPEGSDDRILRAASTLMTRDVVDITVLGTETSIRARAGELGLDLGAARIVSPSDP
ncbi:MAG: phosphotransacetylase family protein, partial [Demequina sp.]|uniref:phosphotransacetylase family protein n=1 Tax=Demequina sp. TaxID=2050685 RepID=UPI003A887E24